jgi:hypothetical protein
MVHALEWLIRRRDDAMAGRVVEGFVQEIALNVRISSRKFA